MSAYRPAALITQMTESAGRIGDHAVLLAGRASCLSPAHDMGVRPGSATACPTDQQLAARLTAILPV